MFFFSSWRHHLIPLCLRLREGENEKKYIYKSPYIGRISRAVQILPFKHGRFTRHAIVMLDFSTTVARPRLNQRRAKVGAKVGKYDKLDRATRATRLVPSTPDSMYLCDPLKVSKLNFSVHRSECNVSERE